MYVKYLIDLHCWEYQWAVWYYCVVCGFVSVIIELPVGLQKVYILITLL